MAMGTRASHTDSDAQPQDALEKCCANQVRTPVILPVASEWRNGMSVPHRRARKQYRCTYPAVMPLPTNSAPSASLRYLRFLGATRASINPRELVTNTPITTPNWIALSDRWVFAISSPILLPPPVHRFSTVAQAFRPTT